MAAGDADVLVRRQIGTVPGWNGARLALPWKALTYEPNIGGYVVDLDKSRLEDAPSYERGERPDWADPAYGRRLDDFYGPFPGF